MLATMQKLIKLLGPTANLENLHCLISSQSVVTPGRTTAELSAV